MSALVLTLATATIVCAIVVATMLRIGWSWALDRPGERSLHSEPTPRTGGLGIMLGLVAAACAFEIIQGGWYWLETGCAVALAGISLIDDKRGLSVQIRLVAHLAIAGVYAALVLSAGKPAHLALILLAGLGLAGFANFYNFMDGANGLAGGMAAIGFGAYAWCSAPHNLALAGMSLALAGAALGFLSFNLKGRIFMGDSGSVPLGFLAGALGLAGWHSGLWTWWFPLLVFAPFGVDAGVTLAKRALRGDRFWQAHREHYYQRMVLMGVSHGRLAAMEYSLMAGCAGAAVWALNLGMQGQIAVFATIGVSFLAIMLMIDARWKRFLART